MWILQQCNTLPTRTSLFEVCWGKLFIHIPTQTIMEKHPQAPWKMVLSTLYLASTTSLIFVSIAEFFQSQRKSQEQG